MTPAQRTTLQRAYALIEEARSIIEGTAQELQDAFDVSAQQDESDLSADSEALADIGSALEDNLTALSEYTTEAQQ